MGIFHSTTRFLASGPQEEDEYCESPSAHPDSQNHHKSYGESSERLLKILISSSSIYKATKGLLQKVCFVFKFLRPRKTTDPLLPIQNPAPSLIGEPLLVPTPLICSPRISNGSSADSILSGINDEEAQCENVGHVSCCQEWPEENHSADEDQMDDDAVAEVRCSIALISESYEEIEEEIAATNLPSLDESVGVKEEEEKIKGIVAVGEERWIKHYSSRHRILLVGEGDFSFSACLAVAFGSATNIIATSLNSKAFLKKNYGNALSNIKKLRGSGSKVMHGIDATEIANHELLGQLKFDRIIFNFPFAGFFHGLSTECQLRLHRRLVSLFLKNAREMISENGEIHISHKTNGNFHAEFKLESMASSHGLRLIAAVKFKCGNYPGYNTKYGFGGDNNFNCNPSKTFKFAL